MSLLKSPRYIGKPTSSATFCAIGGGSNIRDGEVHPLAAPKLCSDVPAIPCKDGSRVKAEYGDFRAVLVSLPLGLLRSGPPQGRAFRPSFGLVLNSNTVLGIRPSRAPRAHLRTRGQRGGAPPLSAGRPSPRGCLARRRRAALDVKLPDLPGYAEGWRTDYALYPGSPQRASGPVVRARRATASTSPRDWKASPRPGAICLSEDAYRQVKARLDLQVSDLGATQLKNIADPLRVYSLQVAKPAEAKPATPVETKADDKVLAFPAPSDKPSIAVLPFQNMSGDPEQEFFADGLVEDIITTLSKLAGLTVIARNFSFAYKGRAVDLRDVGKQLGVRYLLEGSVRRAGDRSKSPRSSSTRIPGRTSGPSATTGRLTTSSPSRTRSRWSSRPKCR